MRRADIRNVSVNSTRPRVSIPGVTGVVAHRAGQRSRWFEVAVDRDEFADAQILGVCGYDSWDNPATSFALLGPHETNTHVEVLDRVETWRVTRPWFTDREDAALAFHTLSGLYGGNPLGHPVRTCDCIYPLGYAWRWWEAVDAEAYILSTLRRPLVGVEMYSSEIVSL